MKRNINKVHPEMARAALKNANGKRNGAYSQYILLWYRSTGRLSPGCNAKDLQNFYDVEEESIRGNAPRRAERYE